MSAGSFEKASWIVGGVLLASYVTAQLWITRAGELGLQEFSRVRQESTMGTQEQFAEGAHPTTGGASGHVLRFGKPDTGDWAATRIVAHDAVPHGALPLAVLRVAALDLEVPVYDGVTEWNLNRGAARIEGTATFAEHGNVGLAAHRDGYFRALQAIRKGDLVEVLTLNRRLQYRVTGMRVVPPHAVEVLAPTKEATLTFVTCYPFRQVGPSPQRFIVRAIRVQEQFSGVSAAYD